MHCILCICIISFMQTHTRHEAKFRVLCKPIAELMSTVNSKRRIKEERDYYLAKEKQLTAELAAIVIEAEAEEEASYKEEEMMTETWV